MFDHPEPETSAHVHILMGTFNGGRWLGAQLDSFLAQTHTCWTLWVSDDGSSDDTRAQLEAFASRHPGRTVRIMDGPRQGSAANFMHLLCHPDLPSGIVALSDQDDVWMPHKLERAVEQLNAAGPTPCVWSARYLISTEDLNFSKHSAIWPRGPSLGNAVVQNILSGHTLTLNPAAVELMRRADRPKVSHHDWWIYLVMMACGARALVDLETVLYYRQHGANIIGGRSSAPAQFKRLSALMKGELHSRIDENLQALASAEKLPLTVTARALVDRWQSHQRLRDKLSLLLDFNVHRQSKIETALFYVSGIISRIRGAAKLK